VLRGEVALLEKHRRWEPRSDHLERRERRGVQVFSEGAGNEVILREAAKESLEWIEIQLFCA